MFQLPLPLRREARGFEPEDIAFSRQLSPRLLLLLEVALFLLDGVALGVLAWPQCAAGLADLLERPEQLFLGGLQKSWNVRRLALLLGQCVPQVLGLERQCLRKASLLLLLLLLLWLLWLLLLWFFLFWLLLLLLLLLLILLLMMLLLLLLLWLWLLLLSLLLLLL